WMTPFHRGLGRVCNRLADATVANCEAARQAVLADEGPPAQSVVVLENGVDLDRFAKVPPLREHAGPVRVGVVANLRPVKGLDVFVRAAAEVAQSHPEVTFAIGGEGGLRPALERQAAELGLGGRLELPGVVADVPGFLGQLDIAVLCSHSEGM